MYGWFLILLVVAAFCGWMVTTYILYRQDRREEVAHLLSTAVESGAPLAPVLRAYLADRPRHGVRTVWTWWVNFLQGRGLRWLWHRLRSFDNKVARLAALIEQGYPLSEALESVPGVAAPETILAARLGETTGRLADCLRGARENPSSKAWLEVVPRFL